MTSQNPKKPAGDLLNINTVNTADRKRLYKLSWFKNGDSLPRKENCVSRGYSEAKS